MLLLLQFNRGELQRKELKDDAVPTIWPNCPNHLSKTAPLPRCTKLTSSSLRSKLDNDRELERLRKDERDTFHSLEELNLWCNGVNINTAILKDPNLSGISCIKSCLLINSYLEFLESTYNESKNSFEDNLKVTIDYIIEQLQNHNW